MCTALCCTPVVGSCTCCTAVVGVCTVCCTPLVAYIRTFNSNSFWEQFANVSILYRRKDHAFRALLPVHWGCHLVVHSHLERIKSSKDLVKVTAARCRVKNGELDFFVWANDENLVEIYFFKKKKQAGVQELAVSVT